MADITIVVRFTGHWSNLTIAQHTCIVTTDAGISEIPANDAWELVSFCEARPDDYTVLNETRSN